MEDLAPFDFSKRVRDTYNNLGFRHIDDANNGDPAGFSVWPLTLQRESKLRWDAATAYVPQTVQSRENLNVFQNVTVSRIVWEDNEGGEKKGERKAKGVEYETKDGKKMFVGVRKDVIVSAGSLRSPAILEQSGVGNPRYVCALFDFSRKVRASAATIAQKMLTGRISILSELKVPVEVELPSLGFNLQDQVLVSIRHNSTANVTGFTPYVTTVTAKDLFGKDLESVESRVREQIPDYAKHNANSSAPGSTTPETQEKLLNLQVRRSNTFFLPVQDAPRQVALLTQFPPTGRSYIQAKCPMRRDPDPSIRQEHRLRRMGSATLLAWTRSFRPGQ